MKTKDVIEYLQAYEELEPLSAERAVRNAAFVFMKPAAIFKLWIEALIWSWGGGRP